MKAKKMSMVAYERSPQDRAKDRREAAKRGMKVESYEGSMADKKADKKLKAKMERKRGKGKKR